MRRALFPVVVQRDLRALLVVASTLGAAVCLALGLTQPVIKFTHLHFWEDTYSILSIIYALWTGGEMFLAAVIFIFSIVFPAIKLVYIAMAGTLATFDPARRGRWFRRIGWLGKWSMLDVLVLALLVFYAKAAQFADAVSLPGVYFFAASVVLTMIAYSLVGAGDAATEPG
jgi:paraquat-inducible protein A